MLIETGWPNRGVIAYNRMRGKSDAILLCQSLSAEDQED